MLYCLSVLNLSFIVYSTNVDPLNIFSLPAGWILSFYRGCWRDIPGRVFHPGCSVLAQLSPAVHMASPAASFCHVSTAGESSPASGSVAPIAFTVPSVCNRSSFPSPAPRSYSTGGFSTIRCAMMVVPSLTRSGSYPWWGFFWAFYLSPRSSGCSLDQLFLSCFECYLLLTSQLLITPIFFSQFFLNKLSPFKLLCVPVARSIPRIQILVSKYHSPIRTINHGFLQKWLTYGCGSENTKWA